MPLSRTLCCLLVVSVLRTAAFAQEIKSGIEWQEPPVVTPGPTDDAPPSDAIVLFDGTDTSAWEGGPWKVADGVMFSGGGDIRTRQKFGDIQLHIEWSAPTEIKGDGQKRGNSGVYLMGLYEVQILDSYNNTTYFDGQAGAIYKQTPPWANAMRKPGEWNTYDIIFTAPQFKVDGSVERPATVTLIHNGVLALNHFTLFGPTSFTELPKYKVHDPTGPVKLQDHGNPVRFRNIWVREIKPPVGRRVSAPFKVSGRRKASPKNSADKQKQQSTERQKKQPDEKAESEKQKKAADKQTRDEQQSNSKAPVAAEKDTEKQQPKS